MNPSPQSSRVSSSTLAARIVALVLAIFIGFGPATPRVRGLEVFDPINYGVALNVLKSAGEQLKTVKDSLGVVTSTLSEVRTVVRQGTELLRYLGDPKTLLAALGITQFLGEVSGIMRQISEIQNLGRKTVDELAGIARDASALTDARNNRFGSGRELGLFTSGIERNTRQYRPFSILEATFEQATKADEETKKKEQDLMKRLADAQEKAKKASTQTELQALQTQIQSLEAGLRTLRSHAQATHQTFQSATMAAQNQRQKEQLAKDEDTEAATTAASAAARRQADTNASLMGSVVAP